MTFSNEADPTTTMVLCGGKGERMGEAYRGQQKVLLDVGGISLLEQVVRGVTQMTDGSPANRNVALLTGHGSEHVREEVAKWPSWLSGRVSTVREYITGRDSLTEMVGHLPKPLTMVSGNVLLDYPSILDEVERKLTTRPNVPVVVGSTILRTSTHYAVKAEGSQVVGLERRASTPAEREVVDVFGITDSVLSYADRKALAPATAIARHVEELQPEHVEYTGNWAHFETPVDFEKYLGGEYGNFDYR